MPRDDVLLEREEYFGESMKTLIPRLLEEKRHVTFQVALYLSVYPNTVRNWLKRNGWEFDHELNRWVKVTLPTIESDEWFKSHGYELAGDLNRWSKVEEPTTKSSPAA